MNPPLANFYDAQNAARLCQASALAYGRDASGSDGSASRPYRVIEDHRTDTRVIVIDERPADLILAFRGTQDLRNWLTDADCKFARASIGRVHAGFAAAFNSVQAALAEAVFEAHHAGKKIWLTGHSLGGALALLAARQLGQPLAGCYTFGQPRVGDAAWRDAYDALLKDRTFRLVHDADAVPRVPWLLGSYRHAGHEVFFPFPDGGARLRRSATPSDQGSTESRPTEGRPMIDPSVLQKLPYDLLGLVDEFANGKLALLEQHHVATYLALFDGGADRPAGLSPDAPQRVPTCALT